MDGPFIKAYKSVLKIPTKGTRGMIAKWVLLELIDRQQRPNGFPVSHSQLGHEIGGAEERTIRRALLDLHKIRVVRTVRRTFVGKVFEVDLERVSQYERSDSPSGVRKSGPFGQRVRKDRTQSPTYHKQNQKETVGHAVLPSVPPSTLANLASKDDVETASEIRHSELGTDPSKLASRYGKSPIDDPLSDVRRLNDVVTSDGRPMMSFDEFRERLGRGESVRLDQVRRTK